MDELTGPAIRGAMLVVTHEDGTRTSYVRHCGRWVPLLVPLLDFDAIAENDESEVSTWATP